VQLRHHVGHVAAGTTVQHRRDREPGGHLDGHRGQDDDHQHLTGGVGREEPPQAAEGEQDPGHHQLQAHHHHHHDLLGQGAVEAHRQQGRGDQQHGLERHRAPRSTRSR
jgi:hypothetical protein